jgi:hypothetical protein
MEWVGVGGAGGGGGRIGAGATGFLLTRSPNPHTHPHKRTRLALIPIVIRLCGDVRRLGLGTGIRHRTRQPRADRGRTPLARAGCRHTSAAACLAVAPLPSCLRWGGGRGMARAKTSGTSAFPQSRMPGTAPPPPPPYPPHRGAGEGRERSDPVSTYKSAAYKPATHTPNARARARHGRPSVCPIAARPQTEGRYTVVRCPPIAHRACTTHDARIQSRPVPFPVSTRQAWSCDAASRPTGLAAPFRSSAAD